MMSPRAIGLCCMVAILTGFSPGVRAETLSARMRREDDRLNRTLRLSAPRIPIGEFLERLSAMTDVSVRADLRDGAADPLIAAFLRDMSLADTMDALWSLMSYREAGWHWERDGKPGAYQYVLTRPPAARNLASRLRASIQKAFEEATETLVEAAMMSPEERAKHKQKILDAMFQTDDSQADAILHQNDRTWEGLRAFGELFPADVRRQILRGQAQPRVPVMALSPEGQSFVRSAWQASQARRRLPNGSTEPVPEPAFVTFYMSDAFRRSAAPTFCIDLQGLGAYAYSGATPLSQAVKRQMADLWTLPGDARSSSMEDRIVSAETPPLVDRKRPVESRLEQLAQGTGISVLAFLPPYRLGDPGTPHKKSVKDFLSSLRERSPYLDHKWRAGILLLTYPAWIWREDEPAPYRLVRRLREARDGAGGFLPFENIVEAVVSLSQSQLRELSEDYQVLGAAAAYQELFRLIGASKQALRALQSERGLPVNKAMAAYLRAHNFGTQAQVPALASGGDDIVAVRFTVQKDETASKPRRSMTLSVRTRDGRWIALAGFTEYKPTKP